jgi:thiamine biosynthesis lipoprotein
MAKRKRLLTFVALAPFLCACAENAAPFQKYENGLFSAYVTIYQNDGNEASANAVMSELESLSVMLDAYSAPTDGSANIYTLNHTNDPVTVSQNMADLLTFMLEMQTKTKGWFNPLSGNLNALWKSALQAETPYVPSQALIDAALSEMKDTEHNYIEINGTTVTRHGTCSIDVGAVGKGWAARTVKHLFADHNSSNYILDVGRSTMIFGTLNSGDGTYTLTFNDCEGKYMKLKDIAVGTSSSSEQQMTVDGVLYTHIVNPFTGSAIPSTTMAGAYGPDAAVCDVMSTTFFAAGLDQTRELASSLGIGYVYYGVDGAFAFGNGVEVYG